MKLLVMTSSPGQEAKYRKVFDRCRKALNLDRYQQTVALAFHHSRPEYNPSLGMSQFSGASTINVIVDNYILVDINDYDGTTYRGREVPQHLKAELGDPADAFAHELKHVEQLASGRLKYDMDRNRLYWLGQRVSEKTPYMDLPHEREAFAFQDWYKRTYGKKT